MYVLRSKLKMKLADGHEQWIVFTSHPISICQVRYEYIVDHSTMYTNDGQGGKKKQRKSNISAGLVDSRGEVRRDGERKVRAYKYYEPFFFFFFLCFQ